MTQIQSTGQSSIRLGDALQLAHEGKLTLKESKSPFSPFQLAKNIDSKNFLVSSFAKLCAGLLAEVKVPTKAITDRQVIPVPSGRRDALRLGGFGNALVMDAKSIKQDNAKLVAQMTTPKVGNDGSQQDYLELAFAQATRAQGLGYKMSELPRSVQENLRNEVKSSLRNLVEAASANNTRLDGKTVMDEMKLTVCKELILCQAYDEICRAKGVEMPLGAKDHLSLMSSIDSLRMTQKPMISQQEWKQSLRDPASPLAQERIHKAVQKFVETRQQTLDHIDQMGLDERQKALFTQRVKSGEDHSSIKDLDKLQAKRGPLLAQLDSFLATKGLDEQLKAFTKSFVQSNLQVTSTAQIDRMLALREPARSLIGVLTNVASSRHEIVGALQDMFKVHVSLVHRMEADAKAAGKEFGEDEKMALIGDAIDFAHAQVGVSDIGAKQLCERLLGKEMAELRDALSFMQTQHAGSHRDEVRPLKALFMLNQLYSVYGQQIGKEAFEIEQDLKTPNLIHETNLPGWTKPLQATHQHFSNSFTQIWSDKVNQAVISDLKAGKTGNTKAPFSSSGIHERFVRDLPRCDLKIDGQSTKDVSDIERFFTNSDGVLNKTDAMTLTSLINQDFFNGLAEALLEHPDIRGTLSFFKSTQHFDLSRLPNGDYKVSFGWETQPNGVLRLDGTHGLLDPRSSMFNVGGTCVIRPGQEPMLVFKQAPLSIREFTRTDDSNVAGGKF